MVNVQKADPIARRKAIWIVLSVVVLGFSLITVYAWNEERIFGFLEAHIDKLVSNPSLAAGLALAIVSPLLFAAAYFFVYGHRAVAAERIPAPRYAVIRDTVVYTGKSAVVRGRVIETLSLVLAILAAVVPLFVWRIFLSLAEAS